jgi:hypothetical protein
MFEDMILSFIQSPLLTSIVIQAGQGSGKTLVFDLKFSDFNIRNSMHHQYKFGRG